MTIPEILYHGTTVLRWAMIERDGLLSSNTPKSFAAEEYFLKGYVFLTNNVDDAITFGLSKSLLDMGLDDLEKVMKSEPNFKCPQVIGVKTANLIDRIEINYGINTPLVKQIPVKRDENSQSYKCKGDIKLENLFAHSYIPFSAFDSNHFNHMKKYHEEKLHASQEIMKRLRSQPKMKQLFPFA